MPLAIAVDALCLLVFAIIGRASHDEGLTLGGVLHTVWPFLAGLALGSAIAAGLRLAPRGLAWGGCAWIGTVLGGMVLRHVDHEGTAAAFIVVAIVFTGACLLGWRLLAPRLRRWPGLG